MKKIVVIGGGNGSAFSICALKSSADKIKLSAVVSMSDSGGSTGRLREEFNTLPPGDIMRAVLAMSRYDYGILKKIFHKNRFFNSGKLDKHNLGNLFLVLAAGYSGDYVSAIRVLEQAVEAVGAAHPATLEKNDMVAELSDSSIVRTESSLDEPSYDRSLKIKRVWLEPDVAAYESAAKAIEEADYVFLGPGSLYTSIIAALLPRGIREATGRSEAKLVYVIGNAIHANGETGPETVSGLVNAINGYLPRKVDFAVFNSHKLDDRQRDYYEQKGWKELAADRENWGGLNIVEDDYERDGGGLCAIKLGKILEQILWK